MKKRALEYFENISKMQTPIQDFKQYDCSYFKINLLYCDMRNTAKMVLTGNIFEDVGRKKIKGLLKKIEIEKNQGIECATSSEAIKKLFLRDLRKIEKNQGVVFNDLG